MALWDGRSLVLWRWGLTPFVVRSYPVRLCLPAWAWHPPPYTAHARPATLLLLR